MPIKKLDAITLILEDGVEGYVAERLLMGVGSMKGVLSVVPYKIDEKDESIIYARVKEEARLALIMALGQIGKKAT